MLFQTPALDEKEKEVLGRIEELRQILGYAFSATPRRWYGLLRRVTFARAVRGSNSIEGYHVTVDDAIAAAEGEEPLEARPEAWEAVKGYQSAMTYVLQLATDLHFAYSTDLLRSLHFMMTQHDLKRNPGRWRPGPIFVRDDDRDEIVYEGPDAEQVPGLMAELVAFLNDGSDGIPAMVKAAMGHLNLVMIHPFSDGNGRMARCLQTLVLARTGVLAPQFSSIEEYLGRNTLAYYDILARVGDGRWNPERDSRPWIRFCLTAHYRQARTLVLRARELEKLWNALESEVRQHGLPERTLLALADAASGLRVRNATYRPVADISEHLAGRDLKLLVDEGFLNARGERRGRHYVASEDLLKIRAQVQEQRQVEDPFEGSGPGEP